MSDLALEDVKRRTEAVLENDRNDGDPEVAHGDQDRLYVDVLRAVADGHPEGAQMAREALRIEDSDGTRWYA